MAQHDYVIANGTGAAVRSDLNNALAAIVSQNSGATEPATTYAFQFWADTTTGTLKLRNSANSAWIELLQLDGTLTMEDGTEALPGLSFRSDLDTGLWRPGTNQLAISTNAVERVEFGASEVVFNDGGANYDFRVEGDTNANLLFVDASADAVGIGTSSPSSLLHIEGTSGNAKIRLGTGGDHTLIGPDSSGHTIINAGTVGGNMQLQLAGTTKVTLNSTGLGIGTTNFGGKLTVKTSSSNGAPTTWGDGQFVVTAGDGTTAPGFGISTNTSDNSISLSALTPGTGWNTIHYRAASHIFYRSDASSNEVGRWDSSGRLLVGTSSARSTYLGAGISAGLNVEGAGSLGGSNRAISVVNGYSASADGGASIYIGRTRSDSIGGTTVVQNNDQLGSIYFVGSDGTSMQAGAQIQAVVDATPGANDMPGRLVFSTTADGASSPTERARITSAGFFKASNSGSYHSSTGEYHEFRQTISNSASLVATASDSSYVGNLIHASATRSATNAYSLLKLESGAFTDAEFNFAGNGNAFADGTFTGGGADYAEYFEWSDSNPEEEDRRGISVVLDDEKIRKAVAGEDPIGVISGNPSIVGDAAWNKWSGKYLRDEFGSYLLDAEGYRQLNPAYDPDVEYIPREQRPEWDCVGLMGKLRIRKGQVTGSRWIKMRDISDSVEEWLVR